MNKAAAAATVDNHVHAKACFITSDNGKDWRPITGTGCAHYVAHTLGIQKGGRGGTACMEGYAVPVRLLLQGLVLVGSINEVRVNDIWFNDATFRPQAGGDHCGIVTAVTSRTDGQGGFAIAVTPTIEITHCSSGQGGVFTNDWATWFHGLGQFYRLPNAAGIEALKDIKFCTFR